MKQSSFFLSLAALVAVGLAFNNCGKVAVSNIEESASKPNGTSSVSGQNNPPGVEQLRQSCQNAKALGKTRVAHLKGSFADPKQQCAWESNGNLSQKNGAIRARTEQIQSFQIPNADASRAVICNIQMKSTLVSKFYYDDNVFLTLNGFVLASTSDFSQHLQSQGGYYKYDWNRLVNKPAQNSKEDTSAGDQYCAGGKQGNSICQFPQTETTGTAQLDIGESVVQSILGMTNAKQFVLAVVTTGDDNSSDCQHVPIDLNLDVEYFVE